MDPIKLGNLTLKVKGFAGTQSKQQVFETHYTPWSNWRAWEPINCSLTDDDIKRLKKAIGREEVRLRCWPKKYARNGIDVYKPKSQKDARELSSGRRKSTAESIKSSGLNASKFKAELGKRFGHRSIKIPKQFFKYVNRWEYDVRYRVKRMIVFGVATGPGGFEAEFELIIPIQIQWELHLIKPCGQEMELVRDTGLTGNFKHTEEGTKLVQKGLEFENGLTDALKKAAEEFSKKLGEGD